LKSGLEQEKNRPAALTAKELDEATAHPGGNQHALGGTTEHQPKTDSEKKALQDQLSQLSGGAAVAAALRAENELLKKQLSDTKALAAGSEKAAQNAQKLAEAEARIATILSDTEVLRLEKMALEGRLKKALATPAAKSATVSREPDLQRIRQLEKERDDYQQKLAAANKELQSGKSREFTAKVEQLTKEVANLKSRVEVFEAKAIPYTPRNLLCSKSRRPNPRPRRIPTPWPGASPSRNCRRARWLWWRKPSDISRTRITRRRRKIIWPSCARTRRTPTPMRTSGRSSWRWAGWMKRKNTSRRRSKLPRTMRTPFRCWAI
jgi:hypothetical protein